MELGNFIKVVEAITPLVESVIGPVFLLIVFFVTRKKLGAFIENISELKFKAGGLEASAISPREQIKAAALLGAAATKESGDVDTGEIADAVSKLATKPKKNQSPRILWVDDIPSNNDYERQALERMGIDFGIATSTKDAIQKLERSNYDLVISDMGRPPDSRAGYTLLDQLRKQGNEIPFVIYAGSRSPEHQRESISHGAIGCTNRADELFVLVSKGLISATT